MCVAIAKPAGVALPSNAALDSCEWSNRDGSGVAWTDGSGVVHIKKDFDNQWALKDWLRNNITVGMACLIHFRQATSGGVSIGLRHPFPLSTDPDVLTSATMDTDLAIIHNGVIWSLDKTEKLSDTAVLVRDILADPNVKASIRDNKAIQQLIGGMIGSSNKLALLWPDGYILTFGEFEKDHGILYSNGQYKTSFGFRGYKNKGSRSHFEIDREYIPGYGYLDPAVHANKKILDKIMSERKADIQDYCGLCFIEFPKKDMYLMDEAKDLRVCKSCHKVAGGKEMGQCSICGEYDLMVDLIQELDGDAEGLYSLICKYCDVDHNFSEK